MGDITNDLIYIDIRVKNIEDRYLGYYEFIPVSDGSITDTIDELIIEKDKHNG